MASSWRPGSRVWRGVQGLPALRTTIASPLTMAQRVTVGQAMETGTAAPGARAEAHGAASADQPEPFQSSTEVPTTAVHDVVVGQETPTRPPWYSATVVAAAPNPTVVPNDCGASQVPSRRVSVWPVLSTTAQSAGEGHDTAVVRAPGCPGPGSAGSAGSGGATGRGRGLDQLVPSPVLT